MYVCFFFFFKQKTAYEMRISDWSSDVCSSDLPSAGLGRAGEGFGGIARTNNGAIFGKHLLHAGVIGNVERFRHVTRLPNAHPQPFHTMNVRRRGVPLDSNLRAVTGEDRKSTRLNSSH